MAMMLTKIMIPLLRTISFILVKLIPKNTTITKEHGTKTKGKTKKIHNQPSPPTMMTLTALMIRLIT